MMQPTRLSTHLVYRAAALCLVLVAVPGEAQERNIEVDARADEAPATGRTALIVGNSEYAQAPLKNPVNDARDIAATLEVAGFDVTLILDGDLPTLSRAVQEFGEKLTEEGGTGLFYYAGHGIQSNGSNYLIPVGAELRHEQRLPFETLDVDEVLAEMDRAKNPFNIVILDACRNNPFARSFRSASRGLAQMDAPSGTFIAYATAPGDVASDGDGDNGLYTQELLRYMEVGGLSINDVFDRTRRSVYEKSNGDQVPWVSTSLMGSFYFKDGDGEVPADLATMRPPPKLGADARSEAASGALVLVFGEGAAARGAETTILRSIVSGDDVRAVDRTSVQMVEGDSEAARAALAGDFSALAQAVEGSDVEYLVVGDLTANAAPSVGRFYTGTAELDVKLYRVSTGSLVNADIFRIGAGGPGKMAQSESLARSQAAEAAGKAAARAVARWIRELDR